MTHSRKPFTIVPALCVLLLSLGLGACESDSPTAPTPTPAPVPGGSGGGPWAVEVTVSPDTVEVPPDDVEASTFVATTTVSVFVRRADTGALPPDNATVVLSASSGTLTANSGSSGSSVPVVLTAGRGQATWSALNPALGTVIFQAQIEGSVGQDVLRIIEGDPAEEPEEPVEIPLFIESVRPSSGPPSGGTRVHIDGTGFEEPTRVTFGGLPADIVSQTESRITVLTPAIDLPVGAIQTVDVGVDINVNETEGQASDTLGNAFTYVRAGGNPTVPLRILSVTPTFGPNEGGTEVAILGEGFGNNPQVFFGSSALIEATVLSVTPQSLLVRTPSATGPNSINRDSVVDVTVRNLDTGETAVQSDAFQYGSPAEPVIITSVGPTEAPYLGNTHVTITGQGFDEPVAVTLAGVAQQTVSVSGSKIVVLTSPVEIDNCSDVSGPTQVVNVETGASASGPTFTFEVIEPTIFSLSPDSSPASGGGQIVISGSGFVAPVGVVFEQPDGPVRASNPTVSADGTEIRATIPAFVGAFDTEPCGEDGERFIPTRVDVRVFDQATDCEDVFENAFTYFPEDTTCHLPPPEASFVTSVTDLTVFVTDTSTGTTAATTYRWNFGDGTIIQNGDPNESHTYAAPGTYTITLTVTNEFGSSTTTQSVDVGEDEEPEPEPDPVEADFLVVTNGLMASFADTSSGSPTSWLWTFGDGATSNLKNPMHTYAVAGNYLVTLTASNATSSDSAAMQVTVP